MKRLAPFSEGTGSNQTSMLAHTSEHPFHLVDSSPWPLFTSAAAFVFLLGNVMYMHSWVWGGYVLAFGFFYVIYCLACWWRDVVVEATFEGQHTRMVQKGLKLGMILFIASEVMFFFAFFWSFFYYSVAPVIWIGGVWPPLGIEAPSPWKIPFLNTLILVFSGISLTWAHYAILAKDRLESLNGLAVTIVAGILFLGLQLFEYIEAPFTISSSVYGSIFFLMTGFHGFHVMMGLAFIVVCTFRQASYHFTSNHHVGFEAASWYWHFVDVVWIGLFIAVYWWGS